MTYVGVLPVCTAAALQVLADQLKTYLPSHSEGGAAVAEPAEAAGEAAAAAPGSKKDN